MATDAVKKRIEAARRRLDALRRQPRAPRNQRVLLEKALDELASALKALYASEATTHAIVDAAVDGIVTIDEHGTVQSFNLAAERQFGFQAEEIIGQNVNMLMPPEHRRVHDDYLANYLSTGRKKIIGIGREITAQRKDGTIFPIELSVSEGIVGKHRLFTGIIRDITERKRTERRLAVQYAVTVVLAESTSLGDASPKLLGVIAEGMGWDLGELWLVDSAAHHLRRAAAWQAASIDAAELPAPRHTTTFERGSGLPGRVWANGTPAWITDIREVKRFAQMPAAEKHDLHAALAFPIRTEGGVLGVMVFLGRERREPEEDWLQTMDVLGRQVGDFLERKHAEEGIRESEGRFRSIITHSPDAIIIVDRDGFVRFVNPAAETLLGRPATTLVSAPFGFPLVSRDTVEVRVLRRAGQSAIADMRTVETEWQGERVCLASLHDVTNRKRMEDKIFQLAAIVASSSDGIIGYDPDGAITSWNEAAERIYGYSTKEAIGQDGRMLLPPGRRDELDRILDRIARGGHLDRFETVRVRRDRTHVDVAITVSPIKDASGRITGASSIARDITERKRAEMQLREFQKIAQQRERLADVGAITAQLVHDLGNPLAGISMQAQLILHRAQRDGRQPLSSVIPAAERILGETHRLDSLVKEFMEFSREQRLDVKAVDVTRFLQHLVQLWQPVAAARSIAVTVEVPAGVPSLTGDEDKLHRVFDNLVKNAIEAIDRGPGEVRLHVNVPAPETIRISVIDTGPGIPDTLQVFRLFETTKPNGSGIGLAVVRQIVLAHRGRIEFSRLQPHGTAFHVELPSASSSS
jgi:PAS domain S-box-containing protein